MSNIKVNQVNQVNPSTRQVFCMPLHISHLVLLLRCMHTPPWLESSERGSTDIPPHQAWCCSRRHIEYFPSCRSRVRQKMGVHKAITMTLGSTRGTNSVHGVMCRIYGLWLATVRAQTRLPNSVLLQSSIPKIRRLVVTPLRAQVPNNGQAPSSGRL